MRKNILITGASSGLGEGMARLFAAQGRNLALCARRTDRLEALKTELLDANPGITISVRALDVNDHQQVFDVFKGFRGDLGSLDRVIVNAGLGKGQPLGTGRFDANLATAQTNFVAALAQFEAALEIFREQKSGHLVAVSSMSAKRGLPRNLTTYSATKAGLATLAEGVRAEGIRGVKVSTIFPGFIASEMNARRSGSTPLMVDTETGCKAMVAAIEREPANASVPLWPWGPIGVLMQVLPLRIVGKVM